MVSNRARGCLLPLVPPRGTVTNVQDCFCFPHVIGVPLEVPPGVKPRFRSLDELSDGIHYGIWPGIEHVLILEDFINLHFAGDDNEYWNFGVWASDVYFNNPTTIRTVHMRESLDRKQSKNKAATCAFEEAMMDSTVLSSLANFRRVPATGSGYSMTSPVVDLSQENMDTSSDNGNSGVTATFLGKRYSMTPPFLPGN
jgi:hypothetical protein